MLLTINEVFVVKKTDCTDPHGGGSGGVSLVRARGPLRGVSAGWHAVRSDPLTRHEQHGLSLGPRPFF
jgi:hypothetical protein